MASGFVAAMLAALSLSTDPFSLLLPVALTAADRHALDRGEVISRTIDGVAGRVGVFAVSRIEADAASLIASARAIEDLKRSPFITGIKRFSNPPRIEDLNELELPPKELNAAASCSPRSCSLKLSPPEMTELREAGAARGPGRSARVQQAFRRVMLARAMAYLAAGAPDPPVLANRPAIAGTESFLYWSQEIYGGGKPVVLITHVNLVPPAAVGDPAIVIGRPVFATHYITGGLAVTAITIDAATGARYLIYRNTTSVDLLGGFFAPLRRAVLESRLKREVPAIIQKLRARLERSERDAR
jgi:hypothetical protein